MRWLLVRLKTFRFAAGRSETKHPDYRTGRLGLFENRNAGLLQDHKDNLRDIHTVGLI